MPAFFETSETNITRTPPPSECAPEDTPREDINYSFVLSPSKQFSYEKRTVPELRTTRDVRVRIVATGLCGSDVGDIFSFY
jgi:L-iditol 2-dehydrogenase